MNIERDKFLTEAMGECWHEWEVVSEACYKCEKCKKYFDGYFPNLEGQNDFSTWEGFGKLWEWAIMQKWWDNFLVLNEFQHTRNVYNPHLEYPYREYDETVYEDMSDLINPDRFANAVYEYLRENK